MSRVAWYRVFVICGAIALLEVLCLAGVIDKITMQAPHLIVRDLYRMLVSGRMNVAIMKTLDNTLLALVLALGVGIVTGALLHRWRAVRDTLDPLFATYYAVPVFAFYPFFIVVFGLGDLPQILIGFMLGVVAVIVNTLNGLDRVPRGAAQDGANHAPFVHRHRATDDAAVRRALPADRRQARRRLRVHRRHRVRVHHVARRHRLRDQLRVHQFRQRDDVPADHVDPDLASVAINGLLSRWEQRLLTRRGMR